MPVHLLTIATVACLTPLVPAGEGKGDNPFRDARVGDYVTYRQTTLFLGNKVEISIRETVSAKGDKELTLRTTATAGRTPLPGHDTRIDLTKPYDPVSAMAEADPARKFEKTGQGKEKIKVGGKTYDCDWVAGRQREKVGKHSSEVKVWFCRSVPLTGRVRVEAKSSIGEETVMEVTGWGSQK